MGWPRSCDNPCCVPLVTLRRPTATVSERSTNHGHTLPSIADIVAIAVALLLAVGGAERITQSDGDLFAHIAMGRWIIDSQAIPRVSLFGDAALPTAFVAPAWGGATIFAFLERIGGLALVAAFTATLAGATHSALAIYMKRRGSDAALVAVASAVGMVLAATHWLARPHAFSIAAAAALLILMDGAGRRAIAAIPVLFLIWANVHGGWAFGLVILGCYTAGTVAESMLTRTGDLRARSMTLIASSVLAALATFANPYGAELHRAILRTLTDPTVSGVIDEYQPPTWRDPGDLLFFAVVISGAILLWRSRRRPPLPSLLVMAVCTLFALRAGRNISLFGVTAIPLLAAHLAPSVSRWWRHSSLAADIGRYDASRAAGRWASGAFALLLAIGAMHGRVGPVRIIQGDVSAQRFPVRGVAALRAQGVQGRVLTSWSWSGYVPFAWPARRTFFDPLAFAPATVTSFGTMLLARDGWRRELDAHQIEVVLAPRSLPLADSLMRDPSWRTSYSDDTAIALQRFAPANR